MKINGYDINYDEAELKDKMENQTLDVRLISPDFEGYKNLSEGNKKALTHLVAAARMVNDVALEQDHPMNLPQKKALAEGSVCRHSSAARAQLLSCRSEPGRVSANSDCHAEGRQKRRSAENTERPHNGSAGRRRIKSD